MKYKFIIIIFVLGLIYDIFGTLFKILHFEIGPVTGNILLIVGTFLKLIATILFLLKIFNNKDKQNFLNQ